MTSTTALLAAPMLFVELKKAEQTKPAADWHTGMSAYIASTYQDDPAKYKEAMDSFARLRTDIGGVGKDAAGRDLLYRYYGQLELLDLRFVFDEEHCAVEFAWHDSFKPTQAAKSQVSLAFERASVIFNLAALHSHMAASANRADAAGIKLAFNYFQCAAGVFNFISDNFLHAPSTDLSKDCIQVVSQLMLAQAQECMLEKVSADGKKPAMAMKLASQAAHMYSQTLEGMSADTGDLKGYFPSAWVLYTKSKMNYMNSLANYYKALQCESDSLFGEQVARLTAADTMAKDAAKLAKDFAGSKCAQVLGAGSAATTKPDSSAASASLLEIIKSNQTVIAEKLRSASRDNDVVYHASVPSFASLAPLDKLNTTKPTKLLELHPDLPSVVGADPFKDLISLQVHEKASLYSSEKDDLIRKESARVSEAEAEADASIRSLGLPGLLDKFRATLKMREGGTVSIDVPKEVVEWAEYIALEEQNEPLDLIFTTLSSKRGSVAQLLDDAVRLLDMERSELTAMKDKHGSLWKQDSGDTQVMQLRREIQNIRDDLAAGNNGDRTLQDKWSSHAETLQFLRSAALDGGKNRMLDKAYADAMSLTSKSNAANSNVGNLLDMPTEHGSGGEQQLIESVDQLLKSIAKCKKDRQITLAALKKKVQEDDIHNLLILNKKNEETVLKVELDKFQPLRQAITDSDALQTRLLEQLANATMSLSSTALAKETDSALQSKLSLTTKYKEARAAFEEIRVNARAGMAFYGKLYQLAEKLHEQCRTFSDSRAAQRAELASTMSQGHQQILTDKLAQLNMGSASPAPYQPYPAANAPSVPYSSGAYGQQAYGTPAAGYGSSPAPSYGGANSSSYGSGIQHSLPPSMQAPLRSVVPEQPSTPTYQYPQNSSAYYQPAPYTQQPVPTAAYAQPYQQPYAPPASAAGPAYYNAPSYNYAANQPQGAVPYGTPAGHQPQYHPQPQPPYQYTTNPQQPQVNRQNSNLLD